MFCPNCGSQQPDDAEFCGVCGTHLAGAAPTVQPTTQAPAAGFRPAPQPTFVPQPATFGAAPTFGAAAAPRLGGLGKRTLAMVGGAVLTLILMFQAWFEFPVIGKLIDLGSSTGSISGPEASLIPSLKVIVNSAFSMPEVLGLSDALHKVASYLNNELMQQSSYGMNNLMLQQAQGAVSTVDLAGTIMMVVFALWLVCVIGIVAGLALKVFKNNEVVLFFALAATGVLALLCVIASLVLNGNAESGINALAQNNTAVMSMMPGFKPILAPTIPAILTVIVAAGSAIGSRFLKD